MDSPSSTDRPDPRTRSLSVRFTAAGRDYFRIWIVNLLLTIVTLGFYLPFAKVRQLRFFHAHTLIDDAPLAFDGDPRKLLRSHVLVGLAVLVYVASSMWAPALAGVAGLVGVAAWPWLMCLSLRFRLGQTRWRGLRFGFNGGVAEAYRIFLPLLVPLALLLMTLPFLASLPTAEAQDVEQAVSALPVPVWVAALPLLSVLAIILVRPWVLMRRMRFQHSHYTLGDEQTRLEGVQSGDVYGLGMRSAGVAVSLSAGALVLGAGISMVPYMVFITMPLMPVAVAGVFTGAMAYTISRRQNLLWGHTRSQHITLASQLHALPLWGLLLKNTVLVGLTLGLYWPFAAVALARMRLEAVSVTTTRPVEQMANQPAERAATAAGVAAEDLLGIDAVI